MLSEECMQRQRNSRRENIGWEHEIVVDEM